MMYNMYDSVQDPEPPVIACMEYSCEVQGCECVCRYRKCDSRTQPLYETACCKILSKRKNTSFTRIIVDSLMLALMHFSLSISLSQRILAAKMPPVLRFPCRLAQQTPSLVSPTLNLVSAAPLYLLYAPATSKPVLQNPNTALRVGIPDLLRRVTAIRGTAATALSV